METESKAGSGMRRVPVLVAAWAPWIGGWKLTSAVSFALCLVGCYLGPWLALAAGWDGTGWKIGNTNKKFTTCLL